jgi:hypothetical protein
VAKFLEQECSPLGILQKHKRERIERKEMSDSLMQESGNISTLGDTFRQTIFNPEPKTNTRSSDLNKQIPQPLSSGKKSHASLNGFDGTDY